MKDILVIGLGQFGQYMVRELCEKGHQVMAVDENEDKVNDVLKYACDAQIGDSTSLEFLKSLGVKNYDVCIVAIGDNFQNSLQTTSLLNELGAKMIVAKSTSDVQSKFLLRNGANEVVYPEKQIARWASIRFTADNIIDYIELDSQNAIFEVCVPKEWIGRNVGEIDIRRKYDINIMAIRESGKINTMVNPSTMLNEGITMFVVGEYKCLQKRFKI